MNRASFEGPMARGFLIAPAENIRSDVLILKPLAERDFSVEGAPDVPKSGTKWQVLERISSVCTLV